MLAILHSVIAILCVVYLIYTVGEIRESSRTHWIRALSAYQQRRSRQVEIMQRGGEEIAGYLERCIVSLLRRDAARKGKDDASDLMNKINSVVVRLTNMVPDRSVGERFEVIRSIAFFQLGDSEEMTRSLQYIAQMGNERDVSFLRKVSSSKQYPDGIRWNARKAVMIVRQRELAKQSAG